MFTILASDQNMIKPQQETYQLSAFNEKKDKRSVLINVGISLISFIIGGVILNLIIFFFFSNKKIDNQNIIQDIKEELDFYEKESYRTKLLICEKDNSSTIFSNQKIMERIKKKCELIKSFAQALEELLPNEIKNIKDSKNMMINLREILKLKNESKVELSKIVDLFMRIGVFSELLGRLSELLLLCCKEERSDLNYLNIEIELQEVLKSTEIIEKIKLLGMKSLDFNMITKVNAKPYYLAFLKFQCKRIEDINSILEKKQNITDQSIEIEKLYMNHISQLIVLLHKKKHISLSDESETLVNDLIRNFIAYEDDSLGLEENIKKLNDILPKEILGSSEIDELNKELEKENRNNLEIYRIIQVIEDIQSIAKTTKELKDKIKKIFSSDKKNTLDYSAIIDYLNIIIALLRSANKSICLLKKNELKEIATWNITDLQLVNLLVTKRIINTFNLTLEKVINQPLNEKNDSLFLQQNNIDQRNISALVINQNSNHNNLNPIIPLIKEEDSTDQIIEKHKEKYEEKIRMYQELIYQKENQINHYIRQVRDINRELDTYKTKFSRLLNDKYKIDNNSSYSISYGTICNKKTELNEIISECEKIIEYFNDVLTEKEKLGKELYDTLNKSDEKTKDTIRLKEKIDLNNDLIEKIKKEKDIFLRVNEILKKVYEAKIPSTGDKKDFKDGIDYTKLSKDFNDKIQTFKTDVSDINYGISQNHNLQIKLSAWEVRIKEMEQIDNILKMIKTQNDKKIK